ncbi:MAG TPA: hypothetical protein VN914_17410 [Polyangia bacterium]|nr:hypothetical protein [Polyangia bacterium]
MRHVARGLAALALLSVTGCEVEGGGLQAIRSGLWDLDDSGSAWYSTWDSGDTSSLSGWEKVTCTVTYGDNYLLRELEAFKEPSSNADNFVARLRATCSEYEDVLGNYVTDLGGGTASTVFSGNYRTPGATVEVSEAFGTLPVGVSLVVNPNSYVKDVKMRWVEDPSGGSNWDFNNVHVTAGATGYSGDPVALTCPDAYVITGVGVRYSTNTGKIRQFRIYCRELEDI